jgi:hypothetical protein
MRAEEMAKPTLHVVFVPSGAAELRKAIAQLGREDEVIELFDDLSFGPINPPDSETRHRWVEHELGYTGWDEITAEAEVFWRKAVSDPNRTVAWWSRRTTNEYAGFLEWLWRLEDSQCKVIDVTELTVADPSNSENPSREVVSLRYLSAEQMRTSQIMERSSELSGQTRGRYREAWRKLRAENAALRVLSGHSLVSAPLSFFDTLLLSQITTRWQKVAMVVGNALTASRKDLIVQVSDLVLAARIRALAESGRIESQGNLTKMRYSEVRLPS